MSPTRKSRVFYELRHLQKIHTSTIVGLKWKKLWTRVRTPSQSGKTKIRNTIRSSHSTKRYLVNWCDAIQCLFTLWCKSPGESSLFVQKCEKKINSGVGNIKFYKFVDQTISKQNLFEAPKNFPQVRKETCLSGLAYYNKAHEKWLIVLPNFMPRRQWRTQNTLARQSANFVVTLSTLVSYCEQ